MKKLLLLAASVVFITSCGGGGGGGSASPVLPSSSTDTPSTNQPTAPSTSAINVVGTVYMSSQSSPSLTSNLYGNNWVLSTRSFEIQALNSDQNDAYQSNFGDYLCYGLLEESLQSTNKDLTSILKDIDVNGDNAADVNISYGPEGGLEMNNIAYKNISRNSFVWNEIPSLEQIQAEGYSSLEAFFRPTDFLFNSYSDLEPNIDLNGDQIPDENLTVNFSLNEINLNPTQLIFYNIRLPGNDFLINKIIENKSEQHFDISLINHDVNFDGIPDINFDYDYDGIAETKLDDNGNCIGDINIVDGAGITVEGAQVSIKEIKDTDGDGYYDYEAEGRTVFSDQEGKFIFENLQSGKFYKLVTIKDRGDKKVWDARVFAIDQGTVLDFDIGAITLTSGPIIMGVESPLEPSHKIGIPLYGKLNFTLANDIVTNGRAQNNRRPIDFLTQKQWRVKLYVQDINNSDVVRPALYWDIEENKRKLTNIPFTTPQFSSSGYYELDFEYRLNDTECFNDVLDSSTEWYQNKAPPGTVPSFCNDSNTLVDSDGNIDYTSVRALQDNFFINNSDDVYSAVTYPGSGDPLQPSTLYPESGGDIVVNFFFPNSSFDDSITSNFEIKSIVVQGEEFPYVNEIDNSINDGRNEFRVESNSDSLNVNIQTKIASSRNGGDPLISYTYSTRSSIGSNPETSLSPTIKTSVGDNVNIDLSSAFPLYSYPIRGTYCMPIDPGLGTCDNNISSPTASNLRGSRITFIPKINQKPAIMRETYVNDVIARDFFNSSIVQVGDTLNFTILFEDPNQLANEVQWSTPEGVRSGWMKPDEPFAYTILASDIGLETRIRYQWRNNDGVASAWVCESCSSLDELFEIDGNWSIWFKVSE
jgi:hypothetical protein